MKLVIRLICLYKEPLEWMWEQAYCLEKKDGVWVSKIDIDNLVWEKLSRLGHDSQDSQ